MDKKYLLALTIYAIDIDGLDLPFTKIAELFKEDAYKEFLLYSAIFKLNPLELYSIHIIKYAKQYVNTYGEFGTIINNFKL